MAFSLVIASTQLVVYSTYLIVLTCKLLMDKVYVLSSVSETVSTTLLLGSG